MRNPLSDELNEFKDSDHTTNFLGNIASTLAILSIITIIGIFFYGVRQLV